jgi:hypothetical protein
MADADRLVVDEVKPPKSERHPGEPRRAIT